MTSGLWSGVSSSLKTDAQLQLLHRFESSGLVLTICFTCENQVNKTELHLNNVLYGEHFWSLMGRIFCPGNHQACCRRCLFFSSHPFLKLCCPIK